MDIPGSQPPSWLGTTRRRAIDAPCRDEGGVRALLSSSTAGAQIVEHSSTKRLVPGPRSKEYEWRPSKQPINVPVPADKPHGLRQVPEPERRGARPVGCRHFVGRTDRSTDESQYAGGVNIVPLRKVLERDGVPRGAGYDSELSLEKSLGRKRHQDDSDLLTLRNGIPAAKLGDKLYGQPEYAPGFYKESGLMPGSTSGLVKPLPPYQRKRVSRFEAMSGAQHTRDLPFGVDPPPMKLPASLRRATLEQRKKAELLVQELNEVERLNPKKSKKKVSKPPAEDDSGDAAGSVVGSQAVGSVVDEALDSDEECWEARTGKYTVPPRTGEEEEAKG